MTFQELAQHGSFWQLIDFCEDLENPVLKSEICDLFRIAERDFYSVLALLTDLGSSFEHSVHGEEERFMKKKFSENTDKGFLSKFSVKEKIQMIVFCVVQADSNSSRHFKELYEKILSSEEFNSISYFLEKLSSQFMRGGQGKVLSFKRNEDSLLKIERSIYHKNLLNIFCRDQREIKILPFKMMKLDGALALIGEEIGTGSCIHLSLGEILSVEELNETYCPINSRFEFEDYIDGLRSIKETQVRLILKIDASFDWDDSLAYQHFGNPCLIKKGNGHMIWAASVEPSEEIFEWISDMGNSVEIIDPSAFKRVYLRYCEDKLSLTA